MELHIKQLQATPAASSRQTGSRPVFGGGNRAGGGDGSAAAFRPSRWKLQLQQSRISSSGMTASVRKASSGTVNSSG